MIPSDPYMLLSYVNMKLRDGFDSLDELCAALDLDKDSLADSLSGIGYEYNPELNQFR